MVLGAIWDRAIPANDILASWRSRLPALSVFGLLTLVLTLGSEVGIAAEEDIENLDAALALANVLRAARREISSQQTLINNPDVSEKNLTGSKLVELVVERLQLSGKSGLLSLPEGSRTQKLIQFQLESIEEVIDENQSVINRKNAGFKGFVPAVFARLVNERFGEKAGHMAAIKVTAPIDLVRNRKSRPDAWEFAVIEEQFRSDDWIKDTLFSEMTSEGTDDVFRVMVPEYYGEGCLSCHGGPKGEMDITGYPKEGGESGDLGGAISITLRQ